MPEVLMRAALLAPALIAVALVLAPACATSAGGGSQLLTVGSAAPAFSAPDQTGTVRSLAELGGRPAVLFFYPKDGTPGCTAEACAFRNAWQRYEKAGVAVVGISTDDVAAHAAFAQQHQLPFPLLADTDAAIARAYGVDVTFRMAKRVSFLVGADGKIVRVFPDVDPGVHAEEVLAAAAAVSDESTGR
jgi:peroxiredoxin Q/BCP